MNTFNIATPKWVTTWLIIAFCTTSIFSFAQNINEYSRHGLFEYQHKYNQKIKFTSVSAFLQENFKANQKYSYKIINQHTDQLGFTHYRIQQKFQGFPIEKSTLLIHVKDGLVKSVNGEWFKNLPELSAKGNLTERKAFEFALQNINAEEYLWETTEAKQLIATGKTQHEGINYTQPKGELVYITVNNELDANKLKLVYKFDIFATNPMSKSNIYVDATSGEIQFRESQIHHAEEEGTAATGYYGNKPITVEENNGTYYTRQSGERSLELFDMKETNIWRPTYLTGETIESETATFSGSGNAQYYIDVYWGAEVTHDFFKEKFNRNSYNNAGSKISLYVNGTGNFAFNNAYWVGTAAYFGNATSGTPLTSLDIVSHEITHGVTRTSANLTYRAESGALNESFSDIFGAYAEHYAGVGDKWTLGEYIFFKRSMSNPNEHNQPDTYLGDKWFDTSSSQDNGGVHYNSGVMNFWFYLISEGGSGTNDNGDVYTVNAIGIEKAAQIAYRTLTSYLTQSSGYTAARPAVINAARDLYGEGSCEVAAVTDAMYAIGVGEAYNGNCGDTEPCDAISGLASSNVNYNAALISWDAIPDISSFNIEYKKSDEQNYFSTSSSSNSKTLSGLSPNTSYNVRVRYTCTNGVVADYSEIAFTTEEDPNACETLTGLNISDITQNTANISWDAVNNINIYQLEYKKSTEAFYTEINANINSFNLNGLTSGTDYQVRVKYTCDSGVDADYVSSTFTTESEPLPCNSITGLSTASIATVSASISWDAVTNVNSYQIAYKKETEASYTNLSSNTNSVLLVNLSANTSYEVKVNYNCSDNQDAEFSSITFTTEENSSGTCDVPEFVDGQYYNTGDQVVYNGIIYEAIYNSTYWSPAYGYWNYIGPCDNNTEGCGVADYIPGHIYNSGDQAVYEGKIYQANNDGTHWSPEYGFWTYIGDCVMAFTFGNPSMNIKDEIKIFPNPAEHFLNIGLNNIQDGTEIVLINMAGKVVLKEKVNALQNDVARIDISNIKPGTYLIKINNQVKQISIR